MKRINPKWLKVIQDTANPCPYFELQNMILKEITWGNALLEIQIEKRHMQPFGVVHGGVFATLIDAAGFWAVFSQADPEVGMTTVDLKLNFLAPAQYGILIGRGRCIKLGRSLGLGEARVENEDGKLLAYGITTVMVQAELQLSDAVRKVPKYIN